MNSTRYGISVLAASICVAVAYRGFSSDNRGESLLAYDTKSHPWKISEDKAFSESGICVTENLSHVTLCESVKIVESLSELKLTQCFCDADCYKYDDCCMNVASGGHVSKYPWKCREVGQGNASKNPISVHQMCPEDWTDIHTRMLCEVEAADFQKNKIEFSYLQDIPVKSLGSGIFYRNVYCAMCNKVSDLEKWNVFLHCNKVYNASSEGVSENVFDFSQSVYDTRTGRFLKVFLEGHKISCRLTVHDFRLDILIQNHKARLCKPLINTCNEGADKTLTKKCNSYSSFVYESIPEKPQRKVYKNFHCALCNDVSVDKITCIDPFYGIFKVDDLKPTLRYLFDFNFGGGNNQLGIDSPCKLSDGLIWDRIKKKCTNFTCGAMFERKGLKCVPRVKDNSNRGLNDTCLKQTLRKESFIMHRNRSVFIKETNKLISVNEYEVNEKDGYEVISINVCMEEDSYLLSLTQIEFWLDEVILSMSIICLILHLSVYSILKELRNCPGKVLMSLSVSILCGHIFLLVGQHISTFWICYVCSILTYLGYFSSFLWMHVMSYDIYRTFSVTHSRNSNERWKFLKYGIYCWVTAISLAALSLLFDLFMHSDNEYRPMYGDPICWFNQRKGLLVFFVLPVSILLTNNVIFFSVTAFRIRKISTETKMVKKFTDRARFLLYVKLTVVLGLTWLLGIFAGIMQASFMWYLFLFFNGFQGVFIFVSFTLKKKILKKLSVKLRIHSDKYKMGKQSAVKRAIYSSLSNLSTLHTTLTTQLSIPNENQDILKAVRKLYPD